MRRAYESAVARGWTPQRPRPEDLYDACGGDGPRALWAMLRFLHAQQAARSAMPPPPVVPCHVCAGVAPAHLFLHDAGCPLASAAAA